MVDQLWLWPLPGTGLFSNGNPDEDLPEILVTAFPDRSGAPHPEFTSLDGLRALS